MQIAGENRDAKREKCFDVRMISVPFGGSKALKQPLRIENIVVLGKDRQQMTATFDDTSKILYIFLKEERHKTEALHQSVGDR